MQKKLNCWEYHKCGREPNGSKAGELGVCPAAVESRLDGVHDGVNAGRSCWVVAGTFCHGKIQGLFAQKYPTCKNCAFYNKVLTENFRNIRISHSLLQTLRTGKSSNSATEEDIH